MFIILAVIAEILGTIGGFGSSLFFVPIAGYFLDFHTVLGVIALFHVSSNLIKMFFFKEGVDKQLILSFGIPAVIFVVIGAFLGKYVDSKTLEIALACFLITISAVFLVFKNTSVKPTMTNSVTGGISSGLIAGLLGTGGAIRGVVLSSYNLKKEVFIATSAVIDLGIDSGRSIVYVLNGYVGKNAVYLIPILFVVSIVGTFIGKKMLAKISEEQFKIIVLALILITGLVSLYKWAFQ